MDKTKHDDDLEAFFDAAQDMTPPVSEGLMARVLDDALAVQAEGERQQTRRSQDRPFTGILSALGGWPAMAGLATAAVAGLWIGFSPALGVGEAMASALGSDGADLYLVDFSTGFEIAFEEGDAG